MPHTPPLSALRIVSRKSQLALRQAGFVRAALQDRHPGLAVEIIGVTTAADRFARRPLPALGGKGAFVKELEQALLQGAADLAVHSVKDVPAQLPAGLSMPTLMRREDPRDVLVSKGCAALTELPAGARVGTSSLRRQCQLRAGYPGLRLLPLRGNVESRLEKLDQGECDGLILAAAGLKRLGLEDRISAFMAVEDMLPAAGQGALGLEIREDDRRTLALIAPLNHRPTALRVGAERAVSLNLYGGCHLPIAAYAEIEGERLCLRALAGRPDGSRVEKNRIRGPLEQFAALGRELGQRLLRQGADEILAEVLDDAGP